MTYSYDYRKELLKLKGEITDTNNILSEVNQNISKENSDLKEVLKTALRKIENNSKEIEMLNNRLSSIEEILKILVVRDTISDMKENIK